MSAGTLQLKNVMERFSLEWRVGPTTTATMLQLVVHIPIGRHSTFVGAETSFENSTPVLFGMDLGPWE